MSTHMTIMMDTSQISHENIQQNILNLKYFALKASSQSQVDITLKANEIYLFSIKYLCEPDLITEGGADQADLFLLELEMRCRVGQLWQQ